MTEYNKMDPEVKGRWIEALRSGQYKQGAHQLKTPDGCNCCLGVLAEINAIPHFRREGSNTTYYDFSEDDRRDADVPDNYCGLDHLAICELIHLNDSGVYDEKVGKYSDPYTFVQIADFIEANL